MGRRRQQPRRAPQRCAATPSACRPPAALAAAALVAALAAAARAAAAARPAPPLPPNLPLTTSVCAADGVEVVIREEDKGAFSAAEPAYSNKWDLVNAAFFYNAQHPDYDGSEDLNAFAKRLCSCRCVQLYGTDLRTAVMTLSDDVNNARADHGACFCTVDPGLHISNRTSSTRRRQLSSGLQRIQYKTELKRRRLQNGNGTAPVVEDFVDAPVTEFSNNDLSYPPPLSPAPPTPAPGPPPAPPAPPPFCIEGQDDFSRNAFCSATIQIVDCTSDRFISQRCIQITRPFLIAFLAGRCMDNVHWEKSELECIEYGGPQYKPATVYDPVAQVTYPNPEAGQLNNGWWVENHGMGQYVRVYTEPGGLAISAGSNIDYNGWGFNNAPPVSEHEANFSIPIKVGYDFRVRLLQHRSP